jgi:hypothetical protein
VSLHRHHCICETVFECALDILPCGDGRALCKEWPDSFCLGCLENMIEHSTPETIASMVETLKEYDPLTVARVREFVGG